MKKTLMNNIKHFVDSNVRHRIDRASNNNNDIIDEELLVIERKFDDIRRICVEAEKKMSAMLQTIGSNAATLTSASSFAETYLSPSALVHGHETQNLMQHKSQSQTTTQNILSSTFKSSKSLVTQNKTKLQLHNNDNNHLSLATKSTNNNKTPSVSPKLLKNCNQKQSQQQTQRQYINDATEFGYDDNDIKRNKKLPIVGFLKFLTKSCYKLKPDSLLATTFTHCSHLQRQLTKLYLSYEFKIEIQCLKPIQHILEIDAPNVIKLRKLFLKSYHDLESLKTKYNIANQKQLHYQQQQHLNQLQAGHYSSASYNLSPSPNQQASMNKLDNLKNDLDEAVCKFEQARDSYATELYAFLCREADLVNLFIKFYEYLEEYQQQTVNVIQNSLPPLNKVIACTARKPAFGTPLEEHLRCVGRPLSLVIELCVHFLYSNGLKEEGLFRVPGSAGKIKKLKNAINAWFVSLASQDELLASQYYNDELYDTNSHHHHHHENHHNAQSSLVAVHNLFRDIVGQPWHSSFELPSNSSNTSLNPSSGGVASSNGQQQHLAQSAAAAPQTNGAFVDSSPSSTLGVTVPSAYSVASSLSLSPCNSSSLGPLVYDVHTIAGLLKLYLRELPEPLFTFELYDRWIEAAMSILRQKQLLVTPDCADTSTLRSRANSAASGREQQPPQTTTTTPRDCLDQVQTTATSSNSERYEDALDSNSTRSTGATGSQCFFAAVLKDMPKASRDNLSFLIRFLHLLTTHSQANKMSASNLSITMAPSLIWPPNSADGGGQSSSSSPTDCGKTLTPSDVASCTGGSSDATTAAALSDAISVQMTSAGISNSMHAYIIENLIMDAETLFADDMQFCIPSLESSPSQMQIYENNNNNIASAWTKSNHPSSSSSSSAFEANSSDKTNTIKARDYRQQNPKGHHHHHHLAHGNQLTSTASASSLLLQANSQLRNINSASPTGLSTASLSSFSSGTSGSVASESKSYDMGYPINNGFDATSGCATGSADLASFSGSVVSVSNDHTNGSTTSSTSSTNQHHHQQSAIEALQHPLSSHTQHPSNSNINRLTNSNINISNSIGTSVFERQSNVVLPPSATICHHPVGGSRQPPEVPPPPAPSARSHHMRQASSCSTGGGDQLAHFVSSRPISVVHSRPPAPPVPPARPRVNMTPSAGSTELQSKPRTSVDEDANFETKPILNKSAVSVRGTGSVAAPPCRPPPVGSTGTVTRPSVPPPGRPQQPEASANPLAAPISFDEP